MKFQVSFTGVEKIDRVFRNLPKEMTHQVLGQAHAAAAKPLVEKEKLLAPEGPTGNLVDSIGAVKTSFKRASVVGEVKAGPRRGRYKGYHGHLSEYGTRERRTKQGWRRGRMRAKPWARPAFRLTKDLVEKGIATQIGRKLLARMKKELR
jgi:hypothetical protein